MGKLSSYRMEAGQKGPEFAPHKFPYEVYGPPSLGFAMLIAGSMKIGLVVFLENVNENHKQNLLPVPEKFEHHSLLNKMPASQPELVLGVLLLLETLGFFSCPADYFVCWHLAIG